MKQVSSTILLVICLLVFSCQSRNNEKAQDMATISMEPGSAVGAPVQNEGMVSDTAIGMPPMEDQVLNNGTPAPLMDWEKKIIKTADVSLEVKNYTVYDRFVHNSTRKFGSYIASEQQRKSDDRMENTVSIKVPVDQFEALINALPGDDAKMIEKRISSEDVTDQLVDTKARIEAKKQVRDRYLVLLQQANKMKDILDVQREINAIQEELEAAQGRVQYLTHQSAYSTINLTYFEVLNGEDSSEKSFLSRLKDALSDGASMISGLLIIIVSFWPILIAGCLIWWLIRRRAAKGSSTPNK